MSFVPAIAKPCPEPPTKENLTFSGGKIESCYGGYYQGVQVSYFCTANPNLAPHKILRCESGGKWTELDDTPWPECSMPVGTTETPDHNNGNSGKVSFKIHHLIRDYNGQVF
jgi:hypothetical protein